MSAGPYSIGSDRWPGLSKLIEEAAEVVQVGGKLIGSGGEVAHFDGSNLKRRLEEEIADLMAATNFFVERNGLDNGAIIRRVQTKLALFDRWQDNAGGDA